MGEIINRGPQAAGLRRWPGPRPNSPRRSRVAGTPYDTMLHDAIKNIDDEREFIEFLTSRNTFTCPTAITDPAFPHRRRQIPGPFRAARRADRFAARGDFRRSEFVSLRIRDGGSAGRRPLDHVPASSVGGPAHPQARAESRQGAKRSAAASAARRG